MNYEVTSDNRTKQFITLSAANNFAYWRIWFGAKNVTIEKL